MKRIIAFILTLIIIFNTNIYSYSNQINNNVKVFEYGVVIENKLYSIEEFDQLLSKSVEIKNEDRSASILVAGTYLIPGVGEVVITITGVVIVAGVTVAVGSWLYKKVISYFKEHTKNKRKSNYDKHTKPRPGRDTEKKKNKKGWKPRK